MGTLALNMITGPGEAAALDRCLSSLKIGQDDCIFNEVVVCVTSHDEEVKKVAQSYGAKTPYFQWSTDDHPHGHFADARNTALDNTESEYVMWIDTDDIILEKHQKAFHQLLKVLENTEYKWAEVFFAPYCVFRDKVGRPLTVFMRERIFKRDIGFL